MPFTTRKLPSFEGVAAGQTATLRCPIGLTYHQIFLTYSGVTLAQINGIRVIANGEVIVRITEAARLDFMNRFDGRAAAAGVLVIDFERFGLITRAAREVTAIGTGLNQGSVPVADPNPITTLTVEVDIDAAAVGSVLSAKARQSAPKPSGLIKKIKEFTYTAGAAGVFEISDLPRGPLINRIFFGNYAANLYTNLVVERNNFIVFERTRAENVAIQTDGVRVSQADYTVYDPTEDGYGAEGLATYDAADLRFKLTLTNAGAVPVIVEYLAPLEV